MSRRYFITGVSSGIGRETAKQLVASGNEVWGIARRESKLQELSSEIDSTLFRFSVCDIADLIACADLRDTMAKQDYVPDIIVLNAAIDVEDSPDQLDVDQSVTMMKINYDGAHYWIASFIEQFLQRGEGQFIGISSIFAHWPDSASVSYSSSKAALSMLFRGLRLRYRATAINFKLIYLGPVDTPINPRFSEHDPSNSLVVASASATARYIEKVCSSSRDNFYFPLYIFIIFTFLRWLPDRPFQFLTSPFKR